MKKEDFIEFSELYIQKSISLMQQLDLEQVWQALSLMHETRLSGKKIFFMGNGGSMSIASHFACDFGKGVKNSKNPHQRHFRVISLDNLPWITARANDGVDYFNETQTVGTYKTGYDAIFVDQLINLYSPGDLVFVISSSGNSPNIVNAIEWVKKQGGKAIALTGFEGGKCRELANVSIVVKTDPGEYGLVEGTHEVIHHLMYEYARHFENKTV